MSGPLSHVHVCMASHRSMAKETEQCFAELQQAGATATVMFNISDTAMARNITLTVGLRRAKEHGRTVCLMVDDDMTFTVEDAQAVASYALQYGPTSAVYALSNGRMAGYCKARGFDWYDSRWETGLGFLAIPTRVLEDLADTSEKIEHDDTEITVFTWSGPEGGKWVSEDYRLCRQMGGVVVAPIGVGHVKPVPLRPDIVTLERIRRNESLSTTSD